MSANDMHTFTCEGCGRLISCRNFSLLQTFIDLHRCAQAEPSPNSLTMIEHLDRVARHKAPEETFGMPIWNNQTREVDHIDLGHVELRADYTRKWTTKKDYDVLQLSDTDSEMLKEMAIGI